MTEIVTPTARRAPYRPAGISGPRLAATRVGAPLRLGRHSTALLVGIIVLILVFATDQILPPTTDRQAELRFWLAGPGHGHGRVRVC